MIFHKASEERKWKQWKEQEERILRESGVSEGVIQRLRELDWQDFNTERRYWEHFSPNQEELYTKELEEQSPVALTIQQLLDSVENEQLLQILLESDKKTLQILLLKMWMPDQAISDHRFRSYIAEKATTKESSSYIEATGRRSR